MLIIFLIVGIIIIISGLIIESKYLFGSGSDIISSVVFYFGVGICTLAGIIFLIMVMDYPYGIDKRIKLYEEENQKIEEKVKVAVENYLQYENKTYTDLKNTNIDLPILIMTYPELSGNELVKNEINLYIENNNKIKEMKEASIYKHYYDWWLYFG